MDDSLPTEFAGRAGSEAVGTRVEVSIIVPARNGEAVLGQCLESLTRQTGVEFEVIVVDDGSTDATGRIARCFSGVRVIEAGALPVGWTGKNNAVVTGTRAARGAWLLFTDADTFHLPGSLARAVREAKTVGADLLSYSPEQVVETFGERAVMPVIFAELAREYPPHKVRDRNSGVAAANGQYILVRRAAYEKVGGHAAVAREILEDVALAQRFREAGYGVHFRYGGDAVRTRMYWSWAQLREGWTKNLVLLFPRARRVAWINFLLWCAAWAGILLAALFWGRWHFAALGFGAVWLLLYGRVRIARFSVANNLIAIGFGAPIFVYLLLRSRLAHSAGVVRWKGRVYESRGERVTAVGAKPLAGIRNQT